MEDRLNNDVVDQKERGKCKEDSSLDIDLKWADYFGWKLACRRRAPGPEALNCLDSRVAMSNIAALYGMSNIATLAMLHYSAVMEMFCGFLSNMIAASNVWLLSSWSIVSETEELSFKFYLILNNFNNFMILKVTCIEQHRSRRIQWPSSWELCISHT